MPNYPSSFDNGTAPGQRSVNNVTSRRDFKYFLEPSVGSYAGFALSLATAATLPNSAVALGSTAFICGAVGTTLVVDGSTFAYMSTATTILVKNQVSGAGASNGIYRVTTTGAAGVSWFITRDTRFDNDAEFKHNTIFSVDSGTANAGTKWYLENYEPFTVGTTTPTFTQVPTSVTFNSTAKYPTDANVGVEELGSWETSFAYNTLNDFKALLNTMQLELDELETSLGSVTAEGNQWMVSSNTFTFNLIYRRFEKLLFQLQRLSEDIDRMNTVGFNGTYPGMGLTSRYPSGFNRLTSTAGGY